MSDAFSPRKLAAASVAAAFAVLAAGCGSSGLPAPKPPAPKPPAPKPRAPEPAACKLDLGSLSISGCRLLKSDPAAVPDPRGLWGRIDCQNDSRAQWIASGGPRPDQSFRRLTVFDGDRVFGERCELGANDSRGNTFNLYREGDHRVTFLWLRLPPSFPLSTHDWQLVMQMKQTQPSDNGNGTPVLALEAQGNRWVLSHSASVDESDSTVELWSAPATTGRWTRFAFDVVYSQKSTAGRIKVYADLNGDGDALDPGEQSPLLTTYTLKRDSAGASIPSHLRVGIYHHEPIACPPPGGCPVDVDDVQVYAAP